MANTLFDQGVEYHTRSKGVLNLTQNHAAMRQTDHDRTKPSKLELLQEDYRSRLLHERERKANALFEKKMRAHLLPKQGSVREFFLNRRMLANTTDASLAVNLPPINSNTRYKGKKSDKTQHVEKQIVDKKKEKERVEAMKCLKEIKTEDNNRIELAKPRAKHRKTKIEYQEEQGDPAWNAGDNSPTFSATGERSGRNNDARNTTRRKARGVKSREVYKRGRKPSGEINEELNTNINSEELSSSFTQSDVSKSLVKIKQLVQRRKTEELLVRSTAAKPVPENNTSSPRQQNSQSFEELCKAEAEIREIISREQKKLLALQQKQKLKITEKRSSRLESRNGTGRKPFEAVEVEQNASQEREKRTRNVKEPKREDHHEMILSKRNAAKPNTQHETVDKMNTKPSTQIKQAQPTQKTSTEPKHEGGEKLSLVDDATIDLVTCSNCGRGFMKARIAKHEKACRKASARVKKPFDARKKRAEGTDMEKYIIMGKDTTDNSVYKAKKRNWRKTHENFIQSIRSARQQDPQPQTPLVNPDYVECSYCQRKFKPSVAERHIPRCKDIKARPRPPRR